MGIVKPLKVLSAKKLEIQQRPSHILNIARRIMKTEGYVSLTIDRVAKEMNCSRPPIYELYDSREDIVMGLAIEDAIQRWKLMKKGLTFKRRPREMLVGMNEFFQVVYPEHLKLMAVLQPNSIRQREQKKISSHWKNMRLVDLILRFA